MRIDGLNPQRLAALQRLHQKTAPDSKTPSFKETLNSFVSDVNAAQKASSDAQKAFLAGETDNIHQVMGASEEAKVAFNLLMELRNKGLDGYNETMRLRL